METEEDNRFENDTGQEESDMLSVQKVKRYCHKLFKKPKNADLENVYDFNNKRRGLAVIINNKYFLNGSKTRFGSEIDIIRLTKMFTCYGFDIIIYNDLTGDEMVSTLKMVAGLPDHHAADCFACFIGSHGDEVRLPGNNISQDVVIGIDGTFVRTKVFVDIFSDVNCPDLQGKPRLFFIQACRGGLLDDGHEVVSTPAPTATSSGEKKRCYKDARGTYSSNTDVTCSPSAPMYPECLLMYASPPGHAAWRKSDGSWFIKCLTEVWLSTPLESVPLLKVLVRVSGLVAKLESSSGKKQVPCILSQLTKDIYFLIKAKNVS